MPNVSRGPGGHLFHPRAWVKEALVPKPLLLTRFVHLPSCLLLDSRLLHGPHFSPAFLWTLSRSNVSTCSRPSLVPSPPAATMVSLSPLCPNFMQAVSLTICCGRRVPGRLCVHSVPSPRCPAWPPGLQPNAHSELLLATLQWQSHCDIMHQTNTLYALTSWRCIQTVLS